MATISLFDRLVVGTEWQWCGHGIITCCALALRNEVGVAHKMTEYHAAAVCSSWRDQGSDGIWLAWMVTVCSRGINGSSSVVATEYWHLSEDVERE